MDPITLSLLAGAAAPIVTGYLGNQAGNHANDQVNTMIQDQMARLNAIPLPDEAKMRIALERVASSGNLTPQQEQSLQLASRDAMQNIQVDPRLKQTQMQHLEMLSKLGTTGITPNERAQLNTIQRSNAADQSSRLKGMLEDQMRRGVGTSESALAQRMLDSQASANTEAQQSDNLAANAWQRALQAMTGASTLAGQMNQQEYNQQSDLARALNTRENTNFLNAAGVQQRNVQGLNAAQQFNLANQQRLNEVNAGKQETEQIRNSQIPMEMYNAQLGKFQAGANLAGKQMDQARTTGQQQSGMYAGIGQGLAGLAGAYGQQQRYNDYMNRVYPQQAPQAQQNNAYAMGTPMEDEYTKQMRLADIASRTS